MEYIGIDIGSTCSKVAVLDEDENILHQSVQPTGWSSVDTAEIIKNMLLEKGICPETGKVVATGYGRVSGGFCICSEQTGRRLRYRVCGRTSGIK